MIPFEIITFDRIWSQDLQLSFTPEHPSRTNFNFDNPLKLRQINILHRFWRRQKNFCILMKGCWQVAISTITFVTTYGDYYFLGRSTIKIPIISCVPVLISSLRFPARCCKVISTCDQTVQMAVTLYHDTILTLSSCSISYISIQERAPDTYHLSHLQVCP